MKPKIIFIFLLSFNFTASSQVNFCSRKIIENYNHIYFNFENKIYLRDSSKTFPFLLNFGYNKGIVKNVKWGNPYIFRNQFILLNFMRNPSLPSHREDLFPTPIFYRFNCIKTSDVLLKVNALEEINESTKVIKIKPTWDQSKLLHYDFVEANGKLLIIFKTDNKILIYSAKDVNNVCANEWEKEMELQHNFSSEYFVAYTKDSKNILLDFETLGQVEINIKNKKIKINSSVKPNVKTNYFYIYKENKNVEKISEKKLKEITSIISDKN